MFISPIVKLLCRVLWFVLNKLLSQKSKSSPHRRRGRAVGSLRVRVRGNYAFISRMKFVTVGIAVTAEIVKRATRNHGYCGNRRTCNQKRKQTSLATGVCNRRGTQAGQITSGKKRDMGGGCSTKKKVHMEHESSSSSSSFFFLLKNLCRCFGAVCGAPAGRVPVLGRIHHRRTPCLCAGFGGPASRYCGAVRG